MIQHLIKSKYQPIGQTVGGVGTYTRFADTDIVNNSTEVVTGTLWSTGLASLITHFSSSAQTTTQRQYYVDVANSLPGSADSVIQYSVAYGHRLGSGSDSLGQLNDSPSRAIFSQYRQLLFPTQSQFRYGATDNETSDSIYAITFKRNRLKERLNPGNFEVPLSVITSRDKNATGSVVCSTQVYTFIDDSSRNAPFVGQFGRAYNLVSGSISNGVFGTTPIYYGKAYPDYGVIIFDGAKLDTNLAFKTQLSSSVECNNHFAMFRSVSSSALQTNAAGDKFGFVARNSEKITSGHYFVRIKNTEFNYSTNPSYTIPGSALNEIANASFKTDPKTYITTVGLYNDYNQLIAVAKVSKPILKSFSKEALIRVKLDF